MRGRQIRPSDNGRERREGLEVDGLHHNPGSIWGGQKHAAKVATIHTLNTRVRVYAQVSDWPRLVLDSLHYIALLDASPHLLLHRNSTRCGGGVGVVPETCLG